MPIHCVGFNHKTANINLRERLAFTDDDIRQFFTKYSHPKSQNRWEEMVILSTCNRVEFYAVTKDISPPNLGQQIADFCQFEAEALEPAIYQYIDEQAVGHLFKVASGLDSMVIGEPQVLGQVTQAYEFALERGTAKKTVSRLFQAAIHTGKRVRSETSIGEQSVSVSSLAAKLVSQKIKNLQTASVVLLGAGAMAELAIEALRKRGVSNINIINRTIANACKLAERWQGEAGVWEGLPHILQESDVLISSTSAPHTVIEFDMISGVLKKRKNSNPLIIIDISIPRDVNPEVDKLPQVELYDIDTLNQAVEQSKEARVREIPKAEEIILQELNDFLEYLSIEKVIPLIIKIRHRADQIRYVELQKTLKRIPDIDSKTQVQLERLTESIVNKILHAPTKRLRAESGGPDISTYERITQSLFGLEDA